jgi:uncharacterized protein YjbI with pentapeptide repeats
MPGLEEVNQQCNLLLTHRRTLAHYLYQKAQLGVGYIPPVIDNGIRESREAIQRIKRILKSWDIAVEDHPDDDFHSFTNAELSIKFQERRREETAASLIKDFCSESNNHRRATIAAMLMSYPDEAAPLLVNSLVYADDDTVKILSYVILSIGNKTLQHLANANRIAQRLLSHEKQREEFALFSPAESKKIISITKSLICKILNSKDSKDIPEFDTTDIDLSNIDLKGVRLRNFYFRKTVLDGSDFADANLKSARFRGASLNKTYFKKANLEQAEFVGVRGNAFFILSHCKEVKFEHSHLSGSDLQAARLFLAVFNHAKFIKSNFSGVKLNGSSINDSFFQLVSFYKTDISEAVVNNCKLSNSSFQFTTVQSTRFECDDFIRVNFDESYLQGSVFVNCNFGGSIFNNCDLSSTQFIDCNLGGITIRRCSLNNANIRNCQLGSTSILDSSLKDSVFEGSNKWNPRKTIISNSDWNNAQFDLANNEFKKWLEANVSP